MQGYGVVIVQYLHDFFGSVIVGGSVFLNFVLVPTLLKRPAGEARAFFETSLKRISPVMGASGGLVFLLGILRGTLFGQIKSFQDLTTPYGITFTAALVLTLFMLFFGPRTGHLLLKNIWKGKKFNPNAAKDTALFLRLPFYIVLLILACMVLMHFGF